MSPLRVRVPEGRVILDAPTELPEGTVVEFGAKDGGDDLDETEGAALHAAIERGLEAARSGRVRSAEAVLAELRSEG